MRRPNPLRWLLRQSCFALCIAACAGSFGQTLAPASAASTAPAPASAGSAGGPKTAASAPKESGSGATGETGETKGKDKSDPGKDKPDPNSKPRLGVGLAIACIALCGAIGGFVDGLGTSLRYRLTVPSFHRVKYRMLESGSPHAAASDLVGAHGNAVLSVAEGGIVSDTKGFVASEIELGSLGDALVGMVAAFSVFVVSSAVFPGTNTTQVLEMGLVNLIGWSLVAGYLGPRLLRLISEKAGNIEKAQKVANEASEAAKVATSKVQVAEKSAQAASLKGDSAEAEAKAATDQAKAVTMSMRATAQASPLLEQAQRLLTMNEVAGVMKPPVDGKDRKTRYLDKAEAMFKLALKRSAGQGSDVGALIGLANTYYGMAELVASANASEDALPYWKKGIEALETALAADPKSAKARYNLACFKAKANTVRGDDTYPADQIFADLRKAYELESEFQHYAFSDDDFSALRLRKPPPKSDDLALIQGPLSAPKGP